MAGVVIVESEHQCRPLLINLVFLVMLSSFSLLEGNQGFCPSDHRQVRQEPHPLTLHFGGTLIFPLM